MSTEAPRIEIRDESALRRPIYADVEELLSPGFLAHEVEVSGVCLSLRTLGPGDFFLMRHRLRPNAPGRLWKEWALASAVWMVDGQVVLGDVNAAARIRPAFSGLPVFALDAVFSIYTSLFNRLSVALSRVEAYCYEDASRSTWRMFGSRSPSTEGVSGIPGTSSLGMNQVQRMWVAFNQAEDERLAWQKDWSAAKLIASAQAPKGVKQMNAREESSRKLEDERRKAVIDRTYYQATGAHVGEQSGMVVYRSVSAEELVDEMDRWARGERDWHDQIVESYKEQIRQKHAAERERHESRMEALGDALPEGAGVGGAVPLIGLTPEQMANLRQPRRGVSTVSEGGAPSRLFDKFVAQEAVAGGVGAGGKAVPAPRPEDQEEGGSRLARDVARRRPTLSTREEG